MERTLEEENKKRKINRIISYVMVGLSLVVLAFCLGQIIRYIALVNENKSLNKDLELLKQDSNYLRDRFSALQNDEYYSVYIDGDYQYVDSVSDTVSRIR